MREMKDSGIEWIGEIPKDWAVSKVKYFYDCYDGKRVPIDAASREAGPYPYWGAGSITDYVSDYLFDEEIVLVGEDGAPFFDHTRPVSFLVNEKVWVNNHIHVLKPKNVNSSYLVYFFNTVDYGSYINGSILNKLTQSSMNNISFCVPSKEEQARIADCLDSKCSQIDSIISKQDAIIEKLKEYKLAIITEAVTKGLNRDVEMKDSGSEYIGSIPNSWILTKIKYVCNTQGRIGFKGYTTADLVDEGEGAYTIGASHLNNGVIDLSEPVYISWEKYYESPEIMVNKGDLLIVQRGSTIGKSAIVDKDYGELTINPSLVLINKISICGKYLLYALSAKYNTEYINLVGNTTAIPMISQKQINDLQIVIPKKEEQELIVNYLDEKCKKIDIEISLLGENVEKIQEYKKSLIYEVVTGKREV